MNARLIKLAFTICSLSILGLASSLHAQDTNTNEVPLPPGYSSGTSPRPPGYFAGVDTGPLYDIQIEGGLLSLAPLQGQANFASVWGPGGHSSIPATVGNLAKYLRAANTNINLVLSADAADVKIGDLKIRSDMNSILEALFVATDGNVRGRGTIGRGMRGSSGKDSWFITAERPANLSHRTVEVFNLSGYINTLNGANEDGVRAKLDEIKLLTVETLHNLYEGRNVENPAFRYHPGTSLLIVTGDSDCMEVARKIINALPGQQKPPMELLDLQSAPSQK